MDLIDELAYSPGQGICMGLSWKCKDDDLHGIVSA